ncbi:ABC transporter permease subunit [Telmatospirillum sp.]|uniref:ABC transporter permease subunit n=1 Tax=Telmatospirillum sp. TaxID=2079197 RepID=UPI002840D882|nr:ribose ABC transporter permease [Telmatospirillum sp.]MDR3438134.1 ribose ABC transporter permease [Telmatospirillum sp.]
MNATKPLSLESNAPQGTASMRNTRKQAIGKVVQVVGMLPILILICVGFQLATGKFLSTGNMAIVLQQSAINIVLGAGMTFVILTGGIDLSVGAILAVSAVAAVSLSLTSLSAFAIPLAMLVGLGFGALNGALVAFVKLPSFIVTLGAMTAVRGVARLLSNDTTVFNPVLPFAWVGNQRVLGVPYLVVIALVVIAISWFILRRTVLGVRIYAVGGNEDAARLSGIKVWSVLLFTYSMAGLMAGLAGAMAAARTLSANGAQLGMGYELDAIAAVILGGTSFVGGIGSIFGTLIGALIIAVLSNGLILMNVSEIWQLIVKGLVIILAVSLDKYRNSRSGRT